MPGFTLQGFCRDCFTATAAGERRCRNCRGPRLLRHDELFSLTIAHIDCDAFYASVEKRDRPELRDKPVIIGGEQRGVVSTACYIARIQGVKSAMPMFEAKKLCPDAVIVRPDMAKYAQAGRQIRDLMMQYTPLVQPLSIDEAFLDLSGTESLHGQPAAITLAKLLTRIESEVGVTASAGLSHNKFLAKLASDIEKPRGYSVIGRQETWAKLAELPVSRIWGVGKATQQKLAKAGITKISQLQHIDKNALLMRFGSLGSRLYHLSRGEDTRDVAIDDDTKSVSAETTFNTDITAFEDLEPILWRLAQRVSRRAKASDLIGKTVTLKLKNTQFQSKTRAASMAEASNLAHRIFDVARPLLLTEAGTIPYRLLGVGISHLQGATMATANPSFDTVDQSLARAEQAIDKIRSRFGDGAVDRGLALKGAKPRER